ncbi:hypothetical protein BC835DRAFT_1413532 [Cytidiella melzeri]|nr:hypothetical protein BC835DRAFT_1413532 [Cytidiella melzeri]
MKPFSDDERDWLHLTFATDVIQQKIRSNAPRVEQLDEQGHAVKVARGCLKGNQDGGFKAAAAEITKLYLQRFGSQFQEDKSDRDFALRCSLRKKQGHTRTTQQRAESDKQFQECIDIPKLTAVSLPNVLMYLANLEQHIYSWVTTHSPNKVQQAKPVRLTDDAPSTHQYTAYGVFKASKPIATSAQRGKESEQGSSALFSIGSWNSSVKQTFDSRTPEELDVLQRKADQLNVRLKEPQDSGMDDVIRAQ